MNCASLIEGTELDFSSGASSAGSQRHRSSFRDREVLKYITSLYLRSLRLCLYSLEVQGLKCLLSFPHGSLHSLKLNSFAVPRSMDVTGLIRHLELIRRGHDPLNVFESEDFPGCSRTVSHPIASLVCNRRMSRFIRDHPNIFAIEMHPEACYKLFEGGFSPTR